MITTVSFLFFSLVALYLSQSFITGNLENLNAFIIITMILSGLFLIVQLKKEWNLVKCTTKKPVYSLNKANGLTVLALTVGAFVTFHLNHSIGLGGVMASAAVGLIGAWALKPYATAIYCGSFVGMACSQIFSNPLYLFIATLISGLVFVLSKYMFVGFGGKLGFTAFIGTFLASIIFQNPLRIVDPLPSSRYLMVFLFVIIAGMATYTLQQSADMDAVSASALIGLIFAVVYPDSTDVVVIAAFCATFTGMSSLNRVKTYSDMFFLSVLTGVMFIAAFSLFDGSGGKLGAIAFLATISGIGMIDFIRAIKRKISDYQKSTLTAEN